MPSSSHARPARLARRISPPAAVRPLSILIVDDGQRQGVVNLVRATFGEQAHVRECDSGLAALEILRRGRIDVVLVDHLLPDMNGLELVSAVAEMADDTAVILMSERGGGQMAAEALKSGARDYLDRQGLTGEALQEAIVAALRTAKVEWRNSRMLGRLRRDQAEVGQQVHDLAQDVQYSVSTLEDSITELKGLGQDQSMRQLVDHFAQVQQSLRRSLAMLHKLSERSAAEKQA